MPVELDVKWMDEPIKEQPVLNPIYKIVRWMLGKRKTQLSYKDLYLIGIGLRNKKDSDTAREESLQNVLTQYKKDHGKLPDGFDEYAVIKKNKDKNE